MPEDGGRMAGHRQPCREFLSVERRSREVHRCIDVNTLTAPFSDVFDGVLRVG